MAYRAINIGDRFQIDGRTYMVRKFSKKDIVIRLVKPPPASVQAQVRANRARENDENLFEENC